MFDPAVYASLLEAVDAAIGSVEKGKTLEELLAYLLESIPGSTELRRNVINEFGTEEIDLIFLHQPCPDGLWFLSALILVECKNWSRPVDSRATSYFADGIRSRGCDTGILVAANDVSGTTAQPSGGRFVAATYLMRDGVKVLVVTLEELHQITTIAEFVALLRRSLMDLVSSGVYRAL
ncbi:MAG: restriction endonuclease [Acidimicrobiales bacterium]